MLLYKHRCDSSSESLTDPYHHMHLLPFQAETARDNATSHKIDYIALANNIKNLDRFIIILFVYTVRKFLAQLSRTEYVFLPCTCIFPPHGHSIWDCCNIMILMCYTQINYSRTLSKAKHMQLFVINKIGAQQKGSPHSVSHALG